jgi:hypothetical protein
MILWHFATFEIVEFDAATPSIFDKLFAASVFDAKGIPEKVGML